MAGLPYKNADKFGLGDSALWEMYPLYIDNGEDVRKQLQAKKIFIPTLWPAVFNLCEETELEYDMARNILPIPVDQRYGIEDMEYIVEEIKEQLL